MEYAILLLLSTLVGLLFWLLRGQAGLRRGLNQLREQLERPAPASPTFDRLVLLLSLRDRLELRQGLPHSPNWSAAPDFLQLIVEHALERHPRRILECGSGLSSLMLARCCRLNGGGRLTSLEDGASYARRSQAGIERYRLADVGRVIHAPLREYRLGGETFRWYDLEGLAQGPIEMLVIDGPVGALHPLARYPALPLLYDRLAPGCVIFLDDAARPDERELVRRWLAAYPGLSHQYLATERGCSILRLAG